MRKPFWFSLASLLTAAFVAAVCCGALRSASVVATAAFTVTSGVLLLGTLDAAFGRDRARAYWLGFALFGWACMFAGC